MLSLVIELNSDKKAKTDKFLDLKNPRDEAIENHAIFTRKSFCH